MVAKTFRGGVHAHYHKEDTASKPIRRLGPPGRVVISLHQHTGAPCEPLVKVGDTVKTGQKIGDSPARLTAPVHASVSGKVVGVSPHPQSGGREVLSVIIESDGADTLDEHVEPRRDADELSADEIKTIIREAGIVGLGGAAFPTHFKLTPPPGKSFDTVIVNGAECEPYLSADHRLMVERAGDVVDGVKLLLKATSVKKAYVGIEENKPDAIEAISQAAKSDERISVVPLKVKYPQGAEKQLIWAILGREVPSGGLPVDVGVVVNNVGTAAAVKDAVCSGMPLVERVVTVAGSCIAEPQNVQVRIGTLLSDLIEACGGCSSPPAKIIIGGPMMGVAQFTTDIPVTKGTSGVLLLGKEEAAPAGPMPCVRCGKCVEACSMRLMPLWIASYAEAGRYGDAERVNALDCIECGCCSFVCPSRRRLVQAIRLAKSEIMARRRKAQAS
ncbi:MAG: electron transport complex subunit RsxC [Firmicutes bacterium]|jgi:electron transport complex protein RnfC|nr:electron transport complex subunit RsxC [Bacillota bacterium]MDH7494966.1 electron transport complex subunit RsxC [Bacillota bacterium]